MESMTRCAQMNRKQRCLGEWVHICDDNGERNFSVFLHLGEIFLYAMIADLREEHEKIFSCQKGKRISESISQWGIQGEPPVRDLCDP